MPAVGPRRRARRSKAAKVARRALNQDTSSGARVLVTLDFNTEDLEGIDMKCQQRVSLPQHINALRDFAGISPFLFNIGWDTMLTGQCDKPIEECLDLDPGNDPLQNMVLYVKVSLAGFVRWQTHTCVHAFGHLHEDAFDGGQFFCLH